MICIFRTQNRILVFVLIMFVFLLSYLFSRSIYMHSVHLKSLDFTCVASNTNIN